MNERITVRIDEEITRLISNIDRGRIINMSALIREAIKAYLKECIDNSSQLIPLEKGEEKNETISIWKYKGTD